MRRALLAVALVLAAGPAAAGPWRALLEADAGGRLLEARERALHLVSGRPESPEAAAAAQWWLDRHRVLPDPEAILEAAPADPPPALAFALGSLAGLLHHRPPPGTLARAELAGPFGNFDRLDLDRGVVPDDGTLPPPGTGWNPEGAPFRLAVRSADGWIAPAEPMLRTGVYLAAWTLDAAAPAEGWLVVELDADADIELDGTVLARPRPLERLEPQVLWFETTLSPGPHRLRVAMASSRVPAVRVRWLPAPGSSPPAAGTAPLAGSPAPSTARRRLPPCEARLVAEGPPRDAERGLLLAALAAARQAPLEERRRLEAASRAASGDPLVELALARLFLTRPTGADASVDYRRCRRHLDAAGRLPGALLLERRLDRRQGRGEDADAILDELLRTAPDDPRVMVSALERALHNRWTREIAEGLDRLRTVLAGSPALADLQLDALRALDRLGAYRHRLEALAAAEPLHPGLLDRLLETTATDAALEVTGAMLEAGDDPGLEVERIRLLLEAGRRDDAARALDAARARWGDLAPLDQLAIQIAEEAGERDAARRALEAALAHAPASVELRTLRWRWGARPFFEPWRTDARELVARAREEGGGDADAVLVLDQAVERVFPDGSSLHYYHGMTLAFTPEGARQAAELNLLPGAELLAVRIHRSDGEVVVPADLGADAQAPLTDVHPGDLVEVEYVAAIDRPGGSIRGHMSPYVYRFADSDRAFGRSEYVLLHPPDLELRIEGNLDGVQRTVATVGGLVATSFRVDSVPPVPMEPFAPPTQELLPWVTYGFGVDWATVGDIVRDRVLGVMPGSPELDAWAGPLLSGPAPLERRLRRLVAALVREVEPGDALLDPRLTAGGAFSLRKGNRLGILLSALAGAGIDADLVLTRPLVYARTHLAVPGMDVFGVPLLRVREGGATVWVDLAEETAGVGHIRPEFQGSDGLLLPMTEPTAACRILDPLPRFPNPELAERIELDGRIHADGSADLSLELNLRGSSARRMVDAVRSLPADRVAMLYQQVASGLFTGATRVEGSIVDPDGSPRLLLSLHLDTACERERDGALVCRQLQVARPVSDALAALPERRYPLVLQLPIVRILRFHLVLPEGFTAAGGPRRLESPFGTVREERSVEDGTFTSTLELEIPAGKIPPERYPEFARFCHAVDTLLGRPLRLVPR